MARRMLAVAAAIDHLHNERKRADLGPDAAGLRGALRARAGRDAGRANRIRSLIEDHGEGIAVVIDGAAFRSRLRLAARRAGLARDGRRRGHRRAGAPAAQRLPARRMRARSRRRGSTRGGRRNLRR